MSRATARTALILALLLSAAGAASALEIGELDLHLGQAWIGNGYTTDADGEPVQGSDVSPLNVTAGFGVDLEFAPRVRFAPTLFFFWQEYLETPSGKAVPTQIETGTAAGEIAGSIGLILSMPYVYEWQLSEDVALLAGASPSVVARLPARPIEGSEVGGLYEYFFSEARFLLPEITGSFLYRLNESLRFGLNLRVFLPLHNLWTQYEVDFYDEAVILPNLELRLTP
ncbi:MAG: hypothetical protein ACLFPO_06090 [Spirochaetaceae bacterium]